MDTPTAEVICAAVMTAAAHSAPPEQKQAALEYCQRVRDSSNGWRLCFDVLGKAGKAAQESGSPSNASTDGSAPLEVLFWCAEVILHRIRTAYASFSPDDENHLKNSLIAYLQACVVVGVVPVPVLNKCCVIIVAMVQQAYPDQWPTLFRDLLRVIETSATQNQATAADFFLRILKTVEEEIVAGEVTNAGGRQAQAMALRVKDAMRERCIPQIVHLWLSILGAAGTQPALARRCLDVMADYIDWIDISLVANERCVPLLYQLLGSSDLQCLACECIGEIVEKRMPLTAKVQLLEQLRVLEVASAINVASTTTEFATATAALITAVGCEAINAVQELQSAMASGDPAALEALGVGAAACSFSVRAATMLQQALLLAYRVTDHPSFTVHAKVVALFIAYTSMLKRIMRDATSQSSPSGMGGGTVNGVPGTPTFAPVASSLIVTDESPTSSDSTSGGIRRVQSMSNITSFLLGVAASPEAQAAANAPTLSEEDLQHVRRMFLFVADCHAYPESYTYASEGAHEVAVDNLRQELIRLLKSLFQVAHDEVVSMIIARTASVFQPATLQSVSFGRVESAIHLLYILGECSPQYLRMPRIGSDPIATVLTELVSGMVSKHTHTVVCLGRMETTVRFHLFLKERPDLLPVVCAMFMDHRGLGHPSRSVRAQACYLFFRLCKAMPDALRRRVGSYLDELLSGLRDALVSIYSRDLLTPFSSVDDDSRKHTAAVFRASPPGVSEEEDGVPLSYNDGTSICETIGLLIRPEVTGVQCPVYVRGIVSFFKDRLDSELAEERLRVWRETDSETAGRRLAELVNAMGSLFKPFSHQDSEAVIQVMSFAFESVIRLYQTIPGHLTVRARVITFLHRMVACLGDGVIAFLPAILPALIATTTPANVVPMLQLMSQLMTRFGSILIPVLEAVLVPIVQKVFECLQTYTHVSDEDVSGSSSSPLLGFPDGTAKGETDASTAHNTAYSVDRQNRRLLKKVYYTFMRALVVGGLGSVLTSGPVGTHSRALLDTMVDGCVLPNDPQVNRMCILSFCRLAQEWVVMGQRDGLSGMEPHLAEFLLQSVLPASLRQFLDRTCDFSNAAWVSALKEVVNLHSFLLLTFEGAYVSVVAEAMGNVFALGEAEVERWCVLLHASVAASTAEKGGLTSNAAAHSRATLREARDFLKGLCAGAWQQQQQQRQQQQLLL